VLIRITDECIASSTDISRVYLRGDYVCVKFHDGDEVSIPCNYGNRYQTMDRLVSEINAASERELDKKLLEISTFIKSNQVK